MRKCPKVERRVLHFVSKVVRVMESKQKEEKKKKEKKNSAAETARISIFWWEAFRRPCIEWKSSGVTMGEPCSVFVSLSSSLTFAHG